MKIRFAEFSDIDLIYRLECSIAKGNVATREMLVERLMTFPEGFYIAEEDDNIIGYIESCLWNNIHFESYEEIKDFPKHHKSDGKTLYIIFLAVNEKYRRRGVGSELVRTLQKYASKKGLKKVQVVSAGDFGVDFYENLGFKVTRKLPHFLPFVHGILMEYQIKK